MKTQSGSGLWPVVQRELRETARRPLHQWLRVAGAAAGVVMVWVIKSEAPETALGAQLFQDIHLLLLFLICGLFPALTADCLARERRDGTLGLLFMTPLTADSIVVGKVLAQTLRALTLWLAVTPLLAIPFLAGGVTWADVAAFFTMEMSAAMICLASGILASCLTDRRGLAFLLAFLLMGAFVGGMRAYNHQRMMSIARTPMRRPMFAVPPGALRLPAMPGGIWYGAPPAGFSRSGWAPPRFVITGAGGFRPAVVSVSFAAIHPPANVLAEEICFAAIILLVSIRLAAFWVERSWQDKVPSVRRQGWVKRYCSPVFKDWFRRRMRATLDRNPIAWLQQYSWRARLAKWGLCLLFVFLDCLALDGADLDGTDLMLKALLLVLAAAYAFAGVNGFFQEKKSGALELILVSPIPVKQIIFGRVWGLWKQFLPSALVLIGSNITFHSMVDPFYHFSRGFGYYAGASTILHNDLWFQKINAEIVAIYLTLPIVATCLALAVKNFFVASALTVAIVYGPAIIWNFPPAYHFEQMVLPVPPLMAYPFSAALAFICLEDTLRRRSYVF